ncbi:NERD domain-containing protein [Subsaxibacter sp. CAU 1640]|uniref:nuclease-related domain-containing protein n=1 Tax=Subsaxibacter sp. CAU 1640 TaxID=2933271 RepID=UPI0020047E69|nr:nuclease-related domain-containing protein [Subsaxibacter sp. CAU 1640]MCK7591449.1 NERD domain-containing protein [Subsaxibacter sp. CAU 1640]
MGFWIITALVVGGCIYVYCEFFENSTSTRRYNTKPSKSGTRAELNLVHLLQNRNVPQETIFHDLYLNTYRDKYSQIDVVVPTKVGIVVFEVKDYSGWLFGRGYQRNWTQVLNYGQQKYRFYNPILQNKTHIDMLKRKLPQEDMPYFSVIVFYGDCELREVTHIPKDVYLAKPHTAYMAFERILNEHPPAVYSDKHHIMRVLNEAVANGQNPDIRALHVQNVRDALGRDRVFD